MRNMGYRLLSTSMSSRCRVALSMLAVLTVLVSPVMAQAQPGNVICSIVTLYQDVAAAVFIIGLMLMILGGALYAGAHLLPSQQRGAMQGYGMGMLVGGIIGVIIAVLAPFLLQIITGNTTAQVVNAANIAANGKCA